MLKSFYPKYILFTSLATYLSSFWWTMSSLRTAFSTLIKCSCMGFTHPCTQTATIQWGLPIPALKLPPSNCYCENQSELCVPSVRWVRIKVGMYNWSIERSIWEKSFECKNILNQVCVFNKIIVDIFHDFIPNKIIRNAKDQT